MKTNDSIRRKIFEIRRRHGFSQENMAELLGISTNSFRKIEKGCTILINERLWEIAKVLEVSVEELVLDDDFSSGMSLADKERRMYVSKIEELRNENMLLKQQLNLLTDKYEGYVKRVK